MKTLITFILILKSSLIFSQVDYCSNCGLFENEEPSTYSKISSIEVHKYKGHPDFENLNEEARQELLKKLIFVQYNELGEVSKYTSSDWSDGFKNRTSSYEFTFDENGNVINLLNQDGPTKHKETFEYDNEQEEITKYVYSYDGVEVDRIIKYSLNKDGLVIKRVEYFGNGTLYKEDSFKYDAKGNETFSDNYGVQTTTTYNYNANNKINTKHSINNYKKGLETEFKYDLAGKIIEEKRKNINGKLISRKTYEYENNLLIKEIQVFYENGNEYSAETTAYEYNAKGNWIKKTIKRNGILSDIEIRTINYRE